MSDDRWMWHKDGRCVRVKQLVEKNLIKVLEIKGYKIEVIWTLWVGVQII